MFDMFLRVLTNLFPLWVLTFGIVALLYPPAFLWMQGDLIVWGLALIMVGMGLTLTVADLRRVASMPGWVGLGLFAQFLIMPLLGWLIARLVDLETAFAVGLILVACCPGGTASNLVTYISKADVALSVLMTTASTFAAILATPLLTSLYAGAYVPVDALSLFLNTLKVVLLPVAIGIGLNHFFPKSVRALNHATPLVSVLFIALICGGILSRNAEAVMAAAPKLLAAVALLHLGGFGLGYLFARILGAPLSARRTISIEVGMQNSGLGAVLARSSFPALPLAAVPAAISATLHSIIGSTLAAWWRRRPSPHSGLPSPPKAAKTSE